MFFALKLNDIHRHWYYFTWNRQFCLSLSLLFLKSSGASSEEVWREVWRLENYCLYRFLSPWHKNVGEYWVKCVTELPFFSVKKRKLLLLHRRFKIVAIFSPLAVLGISSAKTRELPSMKRNRFDINFDKAFFSHPWTDRSGSANGMDNGESFSSCSFSRIFSAAFWMANDL